MVVFDVREAFLARADGAVAASRRDGFPAVVLAPDGRPGITVPEDRAVETTEVEVLKAGPRRRSSSPATRSSCTTRAWSGTTASVFDSSWEQGGPTTIVVVDGWRRRRCIPGFAEALDRPEGRLAGRASWSARRRLRRRRAASIPAGSTLVFVVDILGVV